MLARAAHQHRRQEERARRPMWWRLMQCERRILMRSTVDGKAYDRETSPGGYESQPPPGAFAADQPQDLGMAPLDHLVSPILNAIEALERALDFDDGQSLGRETVTMMAHEKDRELLERWTGVHSSAVAYYAPHLGSQRTVEQARRRLGVVPSSGLPKDA